MRHVSGHGLCAEEQGGLAGEDGDQDTVCPLWNRQVVGRASGGGGGRADSTPACEAQERRREHSVTLFI